MQSSSWCDVSQECVWRVGRRRLPALHHADWGPPSLRSFPPPLPVLPSRPLLPVIWTLLPSHPPPQVMGDSRPHQTLVHPFCLLTARASQIHTSRLWGEGSSNIAACRQMAATSHHIVDDLLSHWAYGTRCRARCMSEEHMCVPCVEAGSLWCRLENVKWWDLSNRNKQLSLQGEFGACSTLFFFSTVACFLHPCLCLTLAVLTVTSMCSRIMAARQWAGRTQMTFGTGVWQRVQIQEWKLDHSSAGPHTQLPPQTQTHPTSSATRNAKYSPKEGWPRGCSRTQSVHVRSPPQVSLRAV